jgi:antirestriction protein ArdC
MSDNKTSHASHESPFRIISDHAIGLLQKGIVPWQLSWNPYGLPRNVSSNYVYSEWNAIYLNAVALHNKYRTPLFLTLKQAATMGGNVRRVEKGYPIAFWKKVVNQYRSIGDEYQADRSYPHSRMICTVYWVFNIDQTEHIWYDMPQLTEQKTPTDIAHSCTKLVEGMPDFPPVRYGHGQPSYNASLDFIKLPGINEFENDNHYYTHLFHKLANSTGHHGRLKRQEVATDEGDGQLFCPKEELTAEFTASMLCAITGVQRQATGNNPSYTESWYKHITGDKTLILKASSQARAAIDYILCTQPSVDQHRISEHTQGIATA